MTRPVSPGAPRAVLVSLLCVGALLATSGCSALVMGESAEPSGSASSAGTRPAKPSKQPPSPTAPAALTDAQARAALVSWADLGEPWAPTQGAATWRDAYLKATAAQPDCARLLEALYTDELLGAPGRAAVGLDDDWDEAQLRHQVAVRPRAEVDRALEWLATLPDTCSGFTARAARDRALQVTVSDLPLPEAGDARQGLLVTVTDEEGDEPVTLTLLAAAVRVGDDAFTVTGGGLGDVPPEAVDAVVDLGARRLAEVRRQARVQV